MKTKFLAILYILLLCPMGAFAVKLPRYVAPVVYADTFVLHTRDYQVATSHPFYDCRLADENYQSRMASHLATDPYANNTTPQTVVVRHAARPGGGTGVIPNPTPLSDALWLLVLLAGGYAIFICIRRARTKSDERP